LHFGKQAQKNKKKEGEESKDNKVLGFRIAVTTNFFLCYLLTLRESNEPSITNLS